VCVCVCVCLCVCDKRERKRLGGVDVKEMGTCLRWESLFHSDVDFIPTIALLLFGTKKTVVSRDSNGNDIAIDMYVPFTSYTLKDALRGVHFLSLSLSLFLDQSLSIYIYIFTFLRGTSQRGR
jgi:hypothetical protein